MIPTPLLRVVSRQGRLRPKFVDPEDPDQLARAGAVVSTVRDAATRGARVGELLDELDEASTADEDPILWRGLAHLCAAATESESAPPLDPVDLRRRLFRAAAAGPALGTLDGPDAAAFVAGWAASEGLSAADVWASLYADLPAEAVLREPDLPDPEALLHRYNLALVQGIVRSAHEVRLRLTRPSPAKVRRLLRWAKFHQLLVRATREADDLVLVVDGPVSLFSASTRYGRALASFVPAIALHDEPWALEARVEWTRQKVHRTLSLSRDDGLRSHLTDAGGWRPKAIEHLLGRFADGAVKGWTASDGELPIRVGAELHFPDLTARAGDRVAHLLALGTWRADRLERLLSALDSEGPTGVVVLAARKGRVDRPGAPLEHPRVVWYADVVPANPLRAALDAFAVPAEPR